MKPCADALLLCAKSEPDSQQPTPLDDSHATRPPRGAFAWGQADLAGAALPGARAGNCNLIGASLSGADCTKIGLAGANLAGAVLRDCRLAGADLTSAQLCQVRRK